MINSSLLKFLKSLSHTDIYTTTHTHVMQLKCLNTNGQATSNFNLTMILYCQVSKSNKYVYWPLVYTAEGIWIPLGFIGKTIDGNGSDDISDNIKCSPNPLRIQKLRLTNNYVRGNYLDTPHIWVSLGTWCHESRWRYRRICL